MRAVIRYTRKLVDGEWVEVPTYLIDGVEVSQAEFDSNCPSKPVDGIFMTDQTNKRVKLSMALGVHSKQAKEAAEHARKSGVPTQFVESGPMAGAAVITSRLHQRKLERTIGEKGLRNYTDYN